MPDISKWGALKIDLGDIFYECNSLVSLPIISENKNDDFENLEEYLSDNIMDNLNLLNQPYYNNNGNEDTQEYNENEEYEEDEEHEENYKKKKSKNTYDSFSFSSLCSKSSDEYDKNNKMHYYQ